jgi:predicted dithiol-disulfide oxidoreductase (DUF899 family)
MSNHRVVSQDQWIEARKAHLVKEKQLTRQRDELARERRELPWARVEKDYVFDSPTGKVTLADLFRGRSQLIVYHFMFGAAWNEGCPSCSYVCDHLEGTLPHLAARDVSLTMVSRAPLAKIEPFKRRMGWHFPWVSSFASDFNFDFQVSFTPIQRARGDVYYNYANQPFPSDEAPGASVFYKDPATGEMFHTYSTYARGLDPLLATYTLLDMVPKGRDEEQLPFGMAWLRHHDRYDAGGFADADRPYWPKVALPATSSCGCGSAQA